MLGRLLSPRALVSASALSLRSMRVDSQDKLWWTWSAVSRPLYPVPLQNVVPEQYERLGVPPSICRFGKILAMIAWLRHLWADLSVCLVPARISCSARKPRPSSATIGSPFRAAQTTTHSLAQAVLRLAASVLGSMETAAHPGNTQNRCPRASRRLSVYWKWISRAKPRGGREPISKEIRALIFQMVAENPTWGAPRIHGELLKLGFHLSEPTVSPWIRRAPGPQDPAKRWLTFLRNHREAIAAITAAPLLDHILEVQSSLLRRLR